MRDRTHQWAVAAGFAVVTVIAVGSAAWWHSSAIDGEKGPMPVVIPLAAPAAGAPERAAARSDLDSAPPPLRALDADPVGSAGDLRGVFDANIDSGDELRRRSAVRAHAACVPAFMPRAGEPPSPEPVIQSLPLAHRAERESAYRALFARCYRFFGDGSSDLQFSHVGALGTTPWQEPGVRVRLALGRGDRDEALRLLGAALIGADAVSVASLSGVASALVEGQNDPTLAVRARAIDAALMLVACDLGMQCGVDALRALQLCAVESLCDGDVPSRVMSQAGSTASDEAAVHRERAHLLALLRSGKSLTAADLFSTP